MDIILQKPATADDFCIAPTNYTAILQRGKIIQKVQPIHVLYHGCNFACKNCPTKLFVGEKIIKSATELASELWERYAKRTDLMIIHTGGGDPFFQPDALFDLAEKIHGLAPQTVATNGSNIPKRFGQKYNLFTTIYITIYHYLDDEYKKYTGHEMSEMIQNVRWLLVNYSNYILFRIVVWRSYTEKDVVPCLDAIANFLDGRIEQTRLWFIPEYEYTTCRHGHRSEMVKTFETEAAKRGWKIR